MCWVTFHRWNFEKKSFVIDKYTGTDFFSIIPQVDRCKFCKNCGKYMHFLYYFLLEFAILTRILYELVFNNL